MSFDKTSSHNRIEENSEEILQSLEQLVPLRTLVVGDFFLDTYTEGSIDRISPEAPVAILKAAREFSKPGGAGNVALNLAAMGNQVALLGRIGNDLAGEQLRSLLSNVDTSALMVEKGIKTGEKQRLLAHQQQILRIDREIISPLSEQSETLLLRRAEQLLQNIDVVCLSDYGKGGCTPNLISALIDLAKKWNRPVVVDPKGSDFKRYAGAAIIKPNLAELYAAVDTTRTLSIDEATAAAFEKCPGVNWLLVTRSDEGMTLYNTWGGRFDFPAHLVQINDVTGAGDTAFAMLAHSWGCGLAPTRCAQLANRSAGIAVQQLGCAQVTLSQIAHSIAHSSFHRKAMAEISPLGLKALLQKHPAILIAIQGNMGVEQIDALIDLLEQSSRSGKFKIALYCSADRLCAQLLRLIKSLRGIDFLFLQKDGLSAIIDANCWSSIYLWNGEIFTCSGSLPMKR